MASRMRCSQALMSREQGATKFVVVPFARDMSAWLQRMREAIAPFEAEA